MEDELINGFKNDVKDLLSSLDNSLLSLEKDKKDIDVIEDVFRALHSLKNSASMFGFNIVGSFSHILEDLCREIKDDKIELTDDILNLILEASDILKKLLDDPNLNNKTLRERHNQVSEKVKLFLEENNDSSEGEDDLLSNNKFQQVFYEEAVDLINQLEEQLLQLEGDTTDKDLVDKIFRIMHTLKGNSNMFGFEHLGEITHHLENIYDEVRSNKIDISREILDITLECIDHFRALLEDTDLSNERNATQQAALLLRIRHVLSFDEADKELPVQKSSTKESGIKTYYLFFNPQRDIFDDGTNPLFFVYDLHELGTCTINPVFTDLPLDDSYQPEACYTSWHIIISTDKSLEEIQEHFLFLKEESQPYIKSLANKDLTKDKKFGEWFMKAAVENKILEDFEGIETPKAKKVEVVNNENQQAKTQEQAITSIRVSSEKIDIMMNLISELVTKQAELSVLASEREIPKLQEVAEGLESISRDLRDNAFSISLIPLEKSVLRFQRLVRDVSTRFKKKVNFIVQGKETELDKTIIEKIIDPIMHILRNSIDHGIEKPEERKKLNKPEEGTIVLKAFPSGANVVIEISDDGAGINLEKVKEYAIKKGIISSTDNLTKDDILKLILNPGFSTADNVSEVSGRGVGMDVVNQKINEIRGELEIETEKNVGTKMTIRLPLTVSIIDSLLVKITDDHYIIPLEVIERCAELPSTEIIKAKNNHIVLDGDYTPILDLRTEFEVESERPDIQRIVLVSFNDRVVGLVVDVIIGNYQAVLKSLSGFYKEQDILSGASILGNGEVALVLDTNRLVTKYAGKIKDLIENKKVEMI